MADGVLSHGIGSVVVRPCSRARQPHVRTRLDHSRRRSGTRERNQGRANASQSCSLQRHQPTPEDKSMLMRYKVCLQLQLLTSVGHSRIAALC